MGKMGLTSATLPFFENEFVKRPNARAFMEVPYFNKELEKYNKRIDCVVFDQRNAIFIECKRLYKSVKAEELKRDIKRLNKSTIQGMLNHSFINTQPSNIYRLAIAETWQESVANWWLGNSSNISWSQGGFPTGLYFSGRVVFEMNSRKLYWLYAYEKIDLKKLKGRNE